MPTTELITEAQIHTNIVRAVDDVLQTMLSTPATLVGTAGEAAALLAGQAQVVGSVGFVGESNGVLYLHFEATTAKQFTGQILGLTPAELLVLPDDQVNDAMGEVTNMVAGSFKNALCDVGHPCKLTIPSILRGTNLIVQPAGVSVRRHSYRFAAGKHSIVAEILMKASD